MKDLEIDRIIKIAVRIAHISQQRLYNPEVVRNINRKGSYPFVPSHMEFLHEFYQLVKNIEKDKKIIDVGAGVSPIIIMLYMLGYENLYALDFEPSYLNALRGYTRNDVEYINKDILSHNYEEYDIIYLFMPINDEKLYNKAIQKITSEMKEGAIVMDFYGPINQTIDKNKNDFIGIPNKISYKRNVVFMKRSKWELNENLQEQLIHQ